MTKRPLTHVYSRRSPDPDIYMTRVEHLRILMDEREKQVVEARRQTEDKMQGYPGIFSTKEETRGEVTALKEILKRVEATIGEIKENQANTSGIAFGKGQSTGWIIGLIVLAVGIGGTIFGTLVGPLVNHLFGK